MKVILCYGDSNTWGRNPATQARYDFDERWTGVLQLELGSGYRVIEEGLNGRTTVWTDPVAEYRNGKHFLVPCLETHRPIDLVILFLGTNDLKRKFSASPYDIGKGMAALVEIVKRSDAGPDGAPPKILMMAPPPVARLSEFAEMFDGAGEKSKKLASHYRQVAAESGCEFLDAAEFVVSSDIDGIHLEQSQHAVLGEALAERVRRILSEA